MADERIVYGARCAWWDSIDQIATTTSGLPLCPHCGSPLFEVANEREWWVGVDRYEAAGNPGYREFVMWLRGKCFRSVDLARVAFDAERGS